LALAGGGGDDGAGDSEVAIPANALDQASAAALNEVDVQLDRGFDVVGQESDAGESDDD